MEIIHILFFGFWAGFMLFFALGKTHKGIQNYEEWSKWLYEKAEENKSEDLEVFEKMHKDAKGGQRLFTKSYVIIFLFYCYTSYMILGTVFL